MQDQKCWADLLVVVLALFVGLVNDPHSRVREQPGPLLLPGKGLLPAPLALAAAVHPVLLFVALPSITLQKREGESDLIRRNVFGLHLTLCAYMHSFVYVCLCAYTCVFA